jgi:hypothetical protein
MNSHFRLQNKKILLLIDNVPSHFDPNYHLTEQDEDDELEASEALTSRNHVRLTRK